MISLILAMGRDHSIGYRNELPWRLPKDLAYFKKTTTGHPVLMGRKTFESIGRPLPGRLNIVATRDASYAPEGVETVTSPQEAALRYKDQELFVIGGAEIYKIFLSQADRIYITWIDESFTADAFFPELPEREWHLVSRVPGERDEKNPYDYEFRVYERIL
ncbi:dihydrofolate reductase [Gorillibacterium massiliense]|uniref:dihydrofolate reductase n=1 Tax=Gorillibacterium massiliense TaxID=1280390 RepID=UPI0004B8A4FA|nr:dihydrofolate reductase [Gorillibacterium massiliense]